jgi:hypothetical protein
MQALAKIEEVLKVKFATSLLCAQIAACEQFRQSPPSGPITRISENVRRTIAKDETRAAIKLERFGLFAILAQKDMRTHDTGDRIAVGNANA